MVQTSQYQSLYYPLTLWFIVHTNQKRTSDENTGLPNNISSVESQKGAINIQRYSIENQRGAITILYFIQQLHPSGSQLNIFEYW